ncbi:chemotaxis protein CheW [uncultured Thiocystis sp.]|jgi:two-component system chemotaxis sensor kinase CheA|uniref:chemotaxis protein CheW n=1 Tax=uncultured Thiocystis sp. TaxID=1202134 RepID=UPI0025EDFA33|nr:chemotaxis protein CheW [uncultured Thiocystis sp.]
MTIDMSRFYQVFFDEAGEHLAAMEALLLELDVDAPDLETLNAIFRAAHSIKGGAGTFGFLDMAQLTHVLETLLDRLRKQETRPTVEMIDAFLGACDVLKAQLAAHQEGAEYADPQIAEVSARLESLSEIAATPASPAPRPPSPALPGTAATASIWLIEFRPDAIDFQSGANLHALRDVLAEMGSVEWLSEGDAEVCVWRIKTWFGKEEILETFAFVCDPERISITANTDVSPASLANADDRDGDPGFGFFAGAPGSERALDPVETDSDEELGFGFFAGAPGSEQALDQDLDGFGLFGGSPGMEQVAAVANQGRAEQEQGYGFFDLAPGTPRIADGNAAPSAESTVERPSPTSGLGAPGPGAAPKRPAVADTSIRVSVEKVDQLINLVGELVITHAMLAESASDLDPVMYERIFGGLSNLERNSRDLQQAVMSIRMLPISFVFNRFPRVVRDIAANLGKKVTLKLIGEDTELDKGLIERLADPLNHLVRNSIDHGIEQPERRREAGKSETGEITLRASHRGGSILVEVRDDGAGLDREKLLAKAAQQGIPMPENPSDKEVWQLIFHAGFSTAERVTDISGRGVGMDVVRRNIEAMNGRVEIDSQAGHGTHIAIRLPLTLAILDGLSVRMGEEIFILPLTAIQESLQPTRDQFKTVAGRGRVAHVNGDYLPLVVLREVFHLDGQPPRHEDGILVIVDTSEGLAALLVDELVAQHQVVIKSLETNYRKVDGVSGATIMGDGRVALILDVDALVRLNRKNS